jgi:hypothetical protein
LSCAIFLAQELQSLTIATQIAISRYITNLLFSSRIQIAISRYITNYCLAQELQSSRIISRYITNLLFSSKIQIAISRYITNLLFSSKFIVQLKNCNPQRLFQDT